MQSFPFFVIAFPSTLGFTELLGGLGGWNGVSLCERLGLALLSLLNMDFVMPSFYIFLLTFENNACPHSSVTLIAFWGTEARVKRAVEMQKRFKNRLFCTLPALHQRGSLLAAVVLGHFRDHSRGDRTLQPTIYEAFPPSPDSAATGGSGCQWCPASAGLCVSLPATDYWEGSIWGWTHPWWRNNYIRKTTVILDVVT